MATNLPLFHWQNRRRNHAEHARLKGGSSADPSRYPWPMMQGLARAFLEADFAQGQKPWGSDPSPSDRPVTQAHSQRMGLQDNPIRVQLGFHTRPLRDGGGKPSWGRTPPPQRPKSQCPSLAKDLAALCAPWMQGFPDSIQQGNKAHPFPDTLLSRVRERLSQECQNGKDHMEVAEGQPFFLNLGTQIGNRGEEDPLPDYPPLQGRDNYPSAKEFTDEIMPLLKKRRKWGWSWDHSPNKKQLRPANVLQTNSVRDQWQGSKNPTRSGQYLMDHGVVLTPISKQTPRNEQQPPQSWIVFKHSTGSMPSSWVPPLQQVAGRRTWEMAGCHRLRIKPGPYSKLTSPRPTDGLRSSNQTGNTRWLILGKNGRLTSPIDLHDLPTD